MFFSQKRSCKKSADAARPAPETGNRSGSDRSETGNRIQGRTRSKRPKSRRQTVRTQFLPARQTNKQSSKSGKKIVFSKRSRNGIQKSKIQYKTVSFSRITMSPLTIGRESPRRDGAGRKPNRQAANRIKHRDRRRYDG